MKIRIVFAALGAIALLSSSIVQSEAAPKPRTAKSLECSKKADAQKLHGKPRSTFMRTCKKS